MVRIFLLHIKSTSLINISKRTLKQS
uniref:Uncharacterized protein n=1 Tax=Rhizophora mucronata TaxID=61149 RepID=A0A2P2Q0B8_RHIMU